MGRHYAMGVNRWICNVLSDMRACNETKNYSPLGGLIEEAQTYANQMESAIQTSKEALTPDEWDNSEKRRLKLKKDILELQIELNNLETQKVGLEYEVLQLEQKTKKTKFNKGK